MSLLSVSGGYGNQEALSEPVYTTKMSKPRTIREELTDQKRYHEERINQINEALDALSPDVERVLDALQKLSS